MSEIRLSHVFSRWCLNYSKAFPNAYTSFIDYESEEIAMMIKQQRGFTLIELMITVAIVAILAMIALPSYQQYIIRSNRAAAQSEMLDIANREQQYFLANRVFADYATLGYTLSNNVAEKYNTPVIVVGTGTPPSFTITLSPKGTQVSDGDLVLGSDGTKSRDGSAAKW